MKPGRELDAKIEEKVFNRSTRKDSVDGDMYTTHTVTSNGISVTTESVVSYYSTSIAAAWEVVEKLIQEGFYLRVVYADTQWFCDIVNENFADVENATFSGAAAETTPHAICLAVLEAVKEKK